MTASLIVIVLFVLALVSLILRRKRGDAAAAATGRNRAIRLAGRLYLLVAVSSVVARNVLDPSPDASPADRLQTLLDGDTATIGFQIAIAILLVIALATGREIDQARAEGRIG
jgi:hypothetical protein